MSEAAVAQRYQPRTVLQPPQERLCDTFVTEGVVTETDAPTDESIAVNFVALQGVSFRSPSPMPPGSLRHLKVGTGQPRLSSRIRVVSCRPRTDGSFVIGAEFF
jgi:hypothetical protein